MNAIEKLIDKYKTPSEAARKLRLERQTVYTWVKQGYISSHHALDVEEATNGEIEIREILELERAVKPAKIKLRVA